ncbi:MAG: glutamine-hydrolyzing GMP synthase [Anaerolineales bacterium]
MSDTIAILDFGSQTSQLIARRVREAQVYCELFPYDTPAEEILALNPSGYILSGGPSSIYEQDAPRIPDFVLQSEQPILGICYGMQALADALGGEVAPAQSREFGSAEIQVDKGDSLLERGSQRVWMSHGDRVDVLPDGFKVIAISENSPHAAMGNPSARIYGVQFHPEVDHTVGGGEILRRFAVEICGARADWDAASIVPKAIKGIRQQVGQGSAIAAVSGGVDSLVASILAYRAVRDQLQSVFVDTGLLRSGEADLVASSVGPLLGRKLKVVDASEEFLAGLQDVTDPEQKRRIIGQHFIRVFEKEAANLKRPRFLIQGTIYPDVVESSGKDREVAARIKTHHNVGGLPEDMDFALVEPLRFLFKDEVRILGSELGIPEDLLQRHPFPGPGLAVRCLGQVTLARLERLRAADRILLEELDTIRAAQAFAVLLPVHSVGVMGDQRTYGETIALRVVTTENFMTADWARIPHDMLARISSRIVNEVPGINRVVYDITSKPPATIEWE